MALDDQEKDRRKEARKIRDRVYRERYREVTAFEDSEKAKVNAEFDPQIDLEDGTIDTLCAQRDAQIQLIDDQIRQLQETKNEIMVSFSAKLDVARGHYSEVVDQRNSRLSDVRTEVARQFPDMAGSGRWSSAAWAGTEYACNLLAQSTHGDPDEEEINLPRP